MLNLMSRLHVAMFSVAAVGTLVVGRNLLMAGVAVYLAAQSVRTVAFSAAFAGQRERHGWTPLGVYSVALGAYILAGVLVTAWALRSLEPPLSVVAAIVAGAWSAGWLFVLVYPRQRARDTG